MSESDRRLDSSDQETGQATAMMAAAALVLFVTLMFMIGASRPASRVGVSAG
jgi:hypothetical protein